MNWKISFCRIIVFNEDEFEFFINKYGHSGVEIILETDKYVFDNQVPTLIIGKEKAFKYDISIGKNNNKIKTNLHWTLSYKENEEKCLHDTDKFIEEYAYEFTSCETITYDAVLDGDFEHFINSRSQVFFNHKMFVFFYKKACYIFVADLLYCINLESIRYTGGSVKHVLYKVFNKYDCVFFSYDNIKAYFPEKELNRITLENIIWTQQNIEFSESNAYSFFNRLEIPKNIPLLMSKLYVTLTEEEEKSCLRFYKKDIITEWLSQQTIFFNNEVDIQGLSVNTINKLKYITLNYSNKRTITGRIHCHDNRFNPQNLPVISETRNHMVSRYKGGKIVVFDYVSFETKLAVFITGDDDFIDKLKDKDLHEETAKIIFDVDTVNKSQRKIGKSFNHTILYGGGQEKLTQTISGLGLNIEEVISKIKNFLEPIFKKIEIITQENKDTHYLINPFGSLIRPKKSWAAFNNFVQSTAADVMINKLYEIKKFIKDKKISFCFQVHDSFVFDFHPSELHQIEEISNLLSILNKVRIPVIHKTGNNFMECTGTKNEETETVLNLSEDTI